MLELVKTNPLTFGIFLAVTIFIILQEYFDPRRSKISNAPDPAPANQNKEETSTDHFVIYCKMIQLKKCWMLPDPNSSSGKILMERCKKMDEESLKKANRSFVYLQSTYERLFKEQSSERAG